MSVVSDRSLLLLTPLVSESAGDELREDRILLTEVLPEGVFTDEEAGTGRESPIVPTPELVGIVASLQIVERKAATVKIIAYLFRVQILFMYKHALQSQPFSLARWAAMLPVTTVTNEEVNFPFLYFLHLIMANSFHFKS